LMMLLALQFLHTWLTRLTTWIFFNGNGAAKDFWWQVEAVICNLDRQQDHNYRIGKALNEDEICSYCLLEGLLPLQICNIARLYNEC
jgi:hypothetical protein